jgi:cytochrome b6-f complex iron-sulfur subunit
MTADRTAPITRCEFLVYVWGASMVFALAAAGSAVYVFALPRLRQFALFHRDAIPALGAPPQRVEVKDKHVWISQTARGVYLLDGRCTHLGCFFTWSEASALFACPCHGSQFERDGTYIAGPAPRSLDRYAGELLGADGRRHTPRSAEPLALDADAQTLTVWVNKLIAGKANA